ncbi:MAG: FmdB family zinc ribbon protein [Actinomycetota bacterium]
MPIYEYACTACGERTEAKQSFDDAPLEICEACGGRLRKLYSPVGIVFKGSGFYSTDAKKSTGASSASSTEKKKAEGGDKKTSTTETKTSKTEAKSESGSSGKDKAS